VLGIANLLTHYLILSYTALKLLGNWCVFVQSCVNVFKSLSALEKSVDKCKVSMQPDENRLIFQLYCHHGNVLLLLIMEFLTFLGLGFFCVCVSVKVELSVSLL